MLPIIAIVGRSNVGKSTLFNIITNSNNKAIFYNINNVTRDRKYEIVNYNNNKFIIIDTAGFKNIKENIKCLISKQIFIAIKESDAVFFMVDSITGLLEDDYILAKYLKNLYKKDVFLIINKVDNKNLKYNSYEFYKLGFKNISFISTAHNYGINNFLNNKLMPYIKKLKNKNIKLKINVDNINYDNFIKIAIIGSPNVGKSTLINCLCKSERMIVDNKPGTTRDSTYIPIKYNDKLYVFIDTAGIKKKNNVNNIIEKFSIMKSIKEIKNSKIVIIIIDAEINISQKDLSLIYKILKYGKSIIIAFNKSDKISEDKKIKIKNNIINKFKYINFIPICFISALYKKGINFLFSLIKKIINIKKKNINTSYLNKILHESIKKHQPPIYNKYRIKLKYVHIGNYDPFTIVIHGNNVNGINIIYKKYLINYFRNKLNISGTPIKIIFKENNNPYIKDKKSNYKSKFK
ncbi:ribosome biogenesis GTPase Der [Candidatus Annandia pinicola]|uniref:ribosome biogenesis GTPase Der n=1 Tax=Candidatus Annandia pinicola TaxID=1345117 RepID=UPI001D00893D|nr:ribosome biogenesis GTPase Der [Candidatus Annandia pinicola]UDG80332.1 GTPase Der [Candidatus Annandia pinicola]